MAEKSIDAWFVDTVLPYEAALMRFLARNWRGPDDIADLRQEVYVRVFDAASKKRPRFAKAFLFMTARNLIIDKVRRSRVVAIETVMDLDALHAPAEEAMPDEKASAREELRRLQNALDDLPERCREVVVMRKINGVSQRDTASRMGISEHTVEKQVQKGVRRLADILYGCAKMGNKVTPEFREEKKT